MATGQSTQDTDAAPTRATIRKRKLFQATLSRMIRAMRRGLLDIRKDGMAIVALQESPDGDLPIWTPASIHCKPGERAAHALKIDTDEHADRAQVSSLGERGASLLHRLILIEHREPQAVYPDRTSAFARHGCRLFGRSRNHSLYAFTL